MRKKLISIIFAVAFIALMSSSVFASKLPDIYGINEQTKECSKFSMGDECFRCILPEGWEEIKDSQCPTGYKEIQKHSVCGAIKNSFCCTLPHSGGSGDCEDLVVNDVEQKCAFVEDINACGKLPENWNQAEEDQFWGKGCLLTYTWLEESLDCEAKKIEKDSFDNQNDILDNQQQKSRTIPILGITTVVIILLLMLWFFLIKRKQK